MLDEIKIYFFKTWAKTGVALGWLYKYIDENGKNFSKIKKETKILNTLKIECDLGDHIQRQVFFFGVYEPIESYLLECLLEESDVVVDAGANIGMYSLFISQKIKTGKVIAFEPVAQNFEILNKNINQNRKNEIILPFNFGLWNESKTMTFTLSKESVNNIGSYTAGHVDSAGFQHNCEVKMMDDVLKNENRIDFIKMDIEGAELYALQGAKEIIKKHRPQLLIEINREACQGFSYDPEEIFHFLKRFDYEFYRISDTQERSGWITSFKEIQQANILAVNEKRKHKMPNSWDAKSIKRYFINQKT